MLTHDIKNRPVIAVWSKSDKKTEVHQKIIEDTGFSRCYRKT